MDCHYYCSAQTRTGIGHLRKPPGVELIPCRLKPLRRTRTLLDPAQTLVWSEQVWLDTTFNSQGSRSWGKLAVKTWRVKTELIIITILHIIITTTSILNLRSKQLRQKYWSIQYAQIKTENIDKYLQHKIKQNHKNISIRLKYQKYMKLLRLMKTVVDAWDLGGKLLRKTIAENFCGKLLRKTSAEYKIHAPDNIR